MKKIIKNTIIPICIIAISLATIYKAFLLGISIYYSHECRKAADNYFKCLVNYDYENAVLYVALQRNETSNDKPMLYREAQQKWIDVMNKYKSENTFVTAYSNLRVSLFRKVPTGHVIINICENGIEKKYTSIIYFRTTHGNWGVWRIDTKSDFGIALSGS